MEVKDNLWFCWYSRIYRPLSPSKLRLMPKMIETSVLHHMQRERSKYVGTLLKLGHRLLVLNWKKDSCIIHTRYTKFSSSLFSLSFVERLGERISQAATKSRKFPKNLQFAKRRTTQIYLFFQNFAFLFHLFQTKWKTYSQFSRKLFNQFMNYLLMMINVLEFCKRAACVKAAAQIRLHFQVENVSLESR